MLDAESIFQMLANKEWEHIARTMHENPQRIGSDPVFAHATKLFEVEFFVETDQLPIAEKLKVYKFPSMLIQLKQRVFSRSFDNTFIERKLRLLKEAENEHLLGYALDNRDHPLAVEIIKEINAQAPEKISDAVRPKVSIKSTSTGNGKPKTTNLFKSRQEQMFFDAVRDVFPTHHPYPNVAVSCVIDHSEVKEHLSVSENDYFFKAIVDFVIFDSANDYEPKYFIELDSSYHDTQRAVKNDRMKDSIFQAANAKLIRIRAFDQAEVTKEKFKQLVVEVMRSL